MTIIKMIMLFTLTMLLNPFFNYAQEQSVTLEFENAAANTELVKNYTMAVEKGDTATMVAQLADDAKIYGLSENFNNPMTITQLTDYYTESFKITNHSLDKNTSYLPLKVTVDQTKASG